MSCRVLLVLMSLMLLQSYEAQNLVPNGSFEEFQECPTTTYADLFGVSHWRSSKFSCDYFNACSSNCSLAVPCNIFGYQEARDGQAYIGLVTYTAISPSSREYFRAELESPLEIGEEYFFSMHCSPSEYWGIASDGLGFRVTRTPYFHDFDGFEFVGNPNPEDVFTYQDGEVLTDSIGWTQIAGSFVADSAYEYLIIGAFNFSDNADTVHLNSNSINNTAYYFIDDVRLSTDSSYVYGGAVGISEELQRTLFIWPNPTHSILSVESVRLIEEVLVYSSHGELVTLELPRAQNFKLDFLGRSPGVYHLILIDKQGKRQYRRVVKSF